VVFRAGRASFIRVHDPAPVFWSLMIRFPEDNNGSPDPVERVTRRRRYGGFRGLPVRAERWKRPGESVRRQRGWIAGADWFMDDPDGSSQEGIAAS
jgi:hypothetical protein